MTNARKLALLLPVLALGTGVASGQSIVSTHSGVIYFFVGSVFLGDEPLEQKFGRFPDVGDGRELRTTLGRAEVLLTPGVFLRIDEKSSIRMLSCKFSDTRVELLGGSAILEVTETAPDTAVTLIYKNWQMRVPGKGVYRVDATPPNVRAYQGKVEVAADGKTDSVTVREGEVLPLAAVLVVDPVKTFGNDDFKDWAVSRSQAIQADNAVSAGIVDDPSKMDSGGQVLGGYSYFPMTGIPSLDIGTPYGLSFWSPYQSTLSSIYFPVYVYGPRYPGWPSGGYGFYQGRPLYASPRAVYPIRTTLPRTSTPGLHPITPLSPHSGTTPPPKITVTSPRPVTPIAPHIATHAGAPH